MEIRLPFSRCHVRTDGRIYFNSRSSWLRASLKYQYALIIRDVRCKETERDNIVTGTGIYPVSYQMGAGNSFAGGDAAGVLN